jgi:hypothetical protein
MENKLTHNQLNEINALMQIAQKRLGKMSNVSIECQVLEKFNVSDITNIEASKNEEVMEFIQQLMFKK